MQNHLVLSAINKEHSQYNRVAAVNIELHYSSTGSKGVRIYNAAVRVNREQHRVADKKDKINTLSLLRNGRNSHKNGESVRLFLMISIIFPRHVLF